MKTPFTIGVSMAIGVIVGAGAIQALHAQGKPAPVIVVVDIEDVTDPEGFKVVTQDPMRSASTATVAQLGGRFISRAANITALDGTPPKRSIFIAFDDAEKAQAWYNSPNQKQINEIRSRTAKSRAFLVEGM